MNQEDQELFNMINESPKRNNQVMINESQVEKIKIDKTNKYKKAKKLKNIAKGAVIVIGIGTAVFFTANLIEKLKIEKPNENIESQYYVEEDVKQIQKEEKIERKEIEDTEEKEFRLKKFDDEEKNIEQTPNANIEIEDFIKGPQFETDKVYDDAYNFFNNTNYNEYLEKYSKMYGVDYNLMVALFMQESFCGLKTNSSCAVGIGQIEKTDRSGSDKVYNYETGQMEEINYNHIESDEQNVKVSCQMMQYGANKFGLNVCAMLTNYNQGITTTNNIVKEIARQRGCTVDDLKYDTAITDWSGYIRVCTKSGDPNYIQNVLSFLGNETISYYINGEQYRVNIKTGEYEKLDTNNEIYEVSHKTK